MLAQFDAGGRLNGIGFDAVLAQNRREFEDPAARVLGRQPRPVAIGRTVARIRATA